MKGTVNPFEPWRPVESRIPPPLHAGRPWRPPPPPSARAAVGEPPLAEPVKPSPRSKPPERPKRPQGQGGLPSAWNTPISPFNARHVVCRTAFRMVLCFFVTLWIVLLIASGDLLRGTHMTRTAALGVCAVVFAGFALSSRYGWHTRLRGMTIALALAGITLWFVPTIHGVNLWSAYRQVEELRSLPAGDVDAYQRGAEARRTLMGEFPSFAGDVWAAEIAWLRRTVDEAIENADRQAKTDPQEALAHLHQLDAYLLGLEHYSLVRKDLESARRRAMQACLKVAQR